MTTYRPQRIPHQVLTVLADHVLGLTDLADRMPSNWSSRKLSTKVYLTLGALQRDGLVRTTSAGYAITAAGRRALADLTDGICVSTDEPVGSVRIFGRAA